MTDNEILKQALKQYGFRNQMVVAIEEMSELQKELCKYMRGVKFTGNILEEMVDVQIMLDQLKMYFKFDDDRMKQERDYKITRLRMRMDRYKQDDIIKRRTQITEASDYDCTVCHSKHTSAPCQEWCGCCPRWLADKEDTSLLSGD